ncbi:MAG: glycosyl transferase, partial [Halanaerobium sp. MSAO_Bac5]
NRQPLKFIQKVGFRGWFTLQIFIGGSVLTHLVAPFFWFLFIFWLLSGTPYFGEFYYGTLLQISLLNLLFGNFLGIYLATIAVFKRKYYSLIIYALLNPIYYLLQSAAAWKALYQLFANPFYWEKTQHGLTSKEVNEND